MNKIPRSSQGVTRRTFILTGVQAAVVGGVGPAAVADSDSAQAPPAATSTAPMPRGVIGNVKISRLLLGGNLVGGVMHCRDLKYVGALFRAYVTEEKLMETFRLAEEHGVNTVFETGGDYVKKYNQRFNGQMQFIPHLEVTAGQSTSQLKDHIEKQVATGAVALYVWGLSGDRLVADGDVVQLGKAVELAKKTGLPVGVGGHSLQVPMACEKHQIPCDFYVKTLHNDNYPSATPKALRKDFMWQDRNSVYYDNMWCIDPEETIAFMKTVPKPWIAYKVLAAGAIYPREGFPFAFKNGADFIAVGMFDFQVKEDCDLVCKVLRQTQVRERAWLG
jgi:hypothetical protein